MEKNDRKQQQQTAAPRLYRVTSPVKTFNGDAHGMKFESGAAVTHDRASAERAFCAGYDVTDQQTGEAWPRRTVAAADAKGE